MLTIQTLCDRYRVGERFDYLFFWGHTGNKVSKNCLSQWYPAGFEIDGVFYPTAEHYMMASKAALFGDVSMHAKILIAQDAPTVKALGRKISGFDQTIWDANCSQIVIDGNFAKFSQNPELKDYLLNTKNKILVEASPYDNVWGIGLDENANNIDNPLVWKGANLLGFALMVVRDRLSRGDE